MPSQTTKPPRGDGAPRPRNWLQRAFALVTGGPRPEPPRPFDFKSMHRSLETLESKAPAKE